MVQGVKDAGAGVAAGVAAAGDQFDVGKHLAKFKAGDFVTYTTGPSAQEPNKTVTGAIEMVQQGGPDGSGGTVTIKDETGRTYGVSGDELKTLNLSQGEGQNIQKAEVGPDGKIVGMPPEQANIQAAEAPRQAGDPRQTMQPAVPAAPGNPPIPFEEPEEELAVAAESRNHQQNMINSLRPGWGNKVVSTIDYTNSDGTVGFGR